MTAVGLYCGLRVHERYGTIKALDSLAKVYRKGSSSHKEFSMENIDNLTKAFRFQYERFHLGCDAIEETGAWDKEKFGEMGAFYENDLLSMILRVIVADGKISEKEVEYLNRNFAFDYTVESLAEVYDNCRAAIGESFDEKFKNGVECMKNINVKLAAIYTEMLGIICDILIASDGEISPNEIQEAQRIKSLLCDITCA